MTISPEVEHVARAIATAHGGDPDQKLQFDPTQIVDPPVMLRTAQPRWTFYVPQAVTHIAAFRAINEFRAWSRAASLD